MDGSRTRKKEKDSTSTRMETHTREIGKTTEGTASELWPTTMARFIAGNGSKANNKEKGNSRSQLGSTTMVNGIQEKCTVEAYISEEMESSSKECGSMENFNSLTSE